jgi:hypothetical protein
MAVNTAKRRAKNQAILASQKKFEPTIDQLDFTTSLSRALGYYSVHTGSKEQRLFAIEFFSKKEPKIAKQLKKLPDHKFQTFGSLCRLMSNEQTDLKQLSEYSPFFTNKLKELLADATKYIEEVEVVKAPTNVISIQERMEDKAREHAGEFEGAIDEWIITRGKSNFSAKNYLLKNEVGAPIAKRIGELFVATAQELREALDGDDDQLTEGYSYLTRRELKKFAEFVETIIADCQQQVQTAKANRAPRKRKPQPPSKVVAKMKYLKDFAEFNLKSIKPETIVGSSEVWVYNTKYRKVTVYKAINDVLTVKGTTIIGFDIKESKTLMLRKPDVFFKGLTMGKRPLNNAMKTLTTKPTVPNGRVNEECILLGAF